MNKFFKSILALGISSAMGLSTANAATYRVVDKGDVDTLKYTYSKQFNASEEMAISGTGLYNFPVQYEYLDDDDFTAIEKYAASYHDRTFGINDIEDSEALRAGNPNANDLYWVVAYLSSKSSDLNYQKIGGTIAMTNLGNGTVETVIWDKAFDDGQLTRSTTDYINGITNAGWIYGNASAPYLPMPFTKEDGTETTFFVRDFTTRGYFSPDGGTTIIPILPPTETEQPEARQFGGESAVLGMSENSVYAVGYASVEINQTKLESIENATQGEGGCADPDILEIMPKEVCILAKTSGLYDLDAVKWTIDANNDYTVESLGVLITPHEDDTRSFSSIVQDINDSGVAVGYSHGWVDESVTSPADDEAVSLYAVVFKDGKVLSVTEDHGEHFDSRAYDINNNGFAVGHTTLYVNGSARTKAYYVDTNQDEPRMVIPDSYFKGASSTARAINNNGLFVGEGEVETHNDSAENPRRREAYVYNIEQSLLSNLNTLTECKSPYTIIEARDINDDNVIAATALVKADRRDAKGEIMLDANGDPEREDVVRSIILEPIPGGEIEDCPEEVNYVERKGASIHWLSLFFIFGLGLTRRLKAK